jgi:hypothetical protein
MPPDLQSQIQRMLDGELSDGELIALENELLENEAARQVYLKLATLHSDLEVLYSGQSTLAKAKVVPIDLIITRQRKRVFKIAAYAAAAIVMISMVLLSLTKMPENPIASFRTTPAADFSLTHDSSLGDTPIGQVLVKGSKLDLRKGILESAFSSGVRVVIEAPCVLRVIAEDRVAVDQGVAWFEVPQKAVGFTVETAELKVVDLGTAFGVDSSLTGHDEVHVIRGAVQVTARVDGGKSETLREGEARRVNDQGQLVEIKINSERFTDTLPGDNGLIGHWKFESRIDGVNTPDSSGNGHIGRFEGGSGIVDDPGRGKVLSLSGKGMVDIDSVKNIPNLLPQRGLTLAAWIKRTPSGLYQRYAFVIGLGQTRDNPIATLGIFNGVVHGFIEGDGSSDQLEVTGDTPVKDGVWTHIAITFDRAENQAISYVNGVAQTSPTDISRVGDGELDWEFGTIGKTLGSGHQQHFEGLIDDVRIYDRPLSVGEIRKLAK